MDSIKSDVIVEARRLAHKQLIPQPLPPETSDEKRFIQSSIDHSPFECNIFATFRFFLPCEEMKMAWLIRNNIW